MVLILSLLVIARYNNTFEACGGAQSEEHRGLAVLPTLHLLPVQYSPSRSGPYLGS